MKRVISLGHPAAVIMTRAVCFVFRKECRRLGLFSWQIEKCVHLKPVAPLCYFPSFLFLKSGLERIRLC